MADYKVTLPNADPVMVRANNKAQAIRFVTHNKVAIEILTTEDAIKLAKAGQELLDATGTPEEPEQPLLEPPAGDLPFGITELPDLIRHGDMIEGDKGGQYEARINIETGMVQLVNGADLVDLRAITPTELEEEQRRLGNETEEKPKGKK